MHPCPRIAEDGRDGLASAWRNDHTCDYCGGLSQEEFFRAVEAGAQVEPTDKNYKAYVNDASPFAGDPCVYMSSNRAADGLFLVTPENIGHLPPGLEGRPHGLRVGDWTKVSVHPAQRRRKFYFQHLDELGRQRFIRLYNEKRMTVWGGSFYVAPYFCRPVAPKP